MRYIKCFTLLIAAAIGLSACSKPYTRWEVAECVTLAQEPNYKDEFRLELITGPSPNSPIMTTRVLKKRESVSNVVSREELREYPSKHSEEYTIRESRLKVEDKTSRSEGIPVPDAPVIVRCEYSNITNSTVHRTDSAGVCKCDLTQDIRLAYEDVTNEKFVVLVQIILPQSEQSQRIEIGRDQLASIYLSLQ